MDVFYFQEEMKTILVVAVLFILLVGAETPQQSWTISTLKEYVDIRFDALDKAITKAEAANEKRLENVNEFRLQLSDQSRTFMPRSEAEGVMKGLNDRLINVEAKMEKNEGTKAGGSIVYAYVASAISMLIAMISFGMMMYKRNVVK